MRALFFKSIIKSFSVLLFIFSLNAFSQTTINAQFNMDFIGRLNPPAMVTDLVASGDIVYVADTKYLYVVSVAVPSAPRVLTQFAAYSPTLISNGKNVYVFGLATNQTAVFDVNNPTALMPVSSNSGFGNLLALTSKYAFTSTSVFDISNPTTPIKVADLPATSSTISSIAVSGNYIYASTSFDGVRVFDMTTLSSITEVGSFPISMRSLTVSGNTLYGFRYNALYIVDINSPKAPVLLNTFTQLFTGNSMVVSGNYVYVADMWEGVKVIDVSARAWPVLAGYYAENIHTTRVAIAGNYVVTGQGVQDLPNGGLVVLRNKQVSRCTPELTLGVANNYSGFFNKDFSGVGISVQGKIANGRDLTVSNFSVGSGVASGQDVIVTGNNASVANGSVMGKLVYANTFTNSNAYIAGGARQASLIDFTAAQTQLYNLWQSFFLGSVNVRSNGVLEIKPVGNGSDIAINFTGTDPKLNFVYLYDNYFNAARTLNIKAPAGSTVLMTVMGSPNFSNISFNYSGVQADHVMILSTGNITLNNVYAPATFFTNGIMTLNGGGILGQIIADSFSGFGALNNSKFLGCIPVNVVYGLK